MATFRDRPDMINRNGRPKKERTLTELIKKYLLKRVQIKGQELTYKQIFIEKLFELAFKGDISAIRLILAYVDGMPIQKNENINKNIDEVEQIQIKVINDNTSKCQ